MGWILTEEKQLKVDANKGQCFVRASVCTADIMRCVPLLGELPLTLALFISLPLQLLSELLDLSDIALCCSLICLQQLGLMQHLQLLQLLLVLGDQLLDLWLQAWTCICENTLYKLSKDLVNLLVSLQVSYIVLQVSYCQHPFRSPHTWNFFLPMYFTHFV